MADISQLGNLNSAEPIDLDMYPEAKESPSLPRAGRYTARAPESFAFAATKTNFLSAEVNPTIVGPTNEGYTIKYTRVSAKPFERDGKPLSQLGLYLKACGLSGTVAVTPQEQANAVEQTANRVYQIDVDWKAYNKNTGLTVEGMKNFPANGSADTHQPWVEDKNDPDENGKPRRVWANLQVKRFLPVSV